MSTPQDLPPLPPRSVPAKPESVINPSNCEHEWIQDIWMSGHTHTTHPKLASETDSHLQLIPLFRCLKCGLIRLPIAEDATPPTPSSEPSNL